MYEDRTQNYDSEIDEFISCIIISLHPFPATSFIAIADYDSYKTTNRTETETFPWES